jgi:hypothetical protein
LFLLGKNYHLAYTYCKDSEGKNTSTLPDFRARCAQTILAWVTKNVGCKPSFIDQHLFIKQIYYKKINRWQKFKIVKSGKFRVFWRTL